MASIGENIRAFLFGAPERKEAPQVVMNYTGVQHYRRDKFDAYADEGYRQNAIVYRCVNEIAHGAASIPSTQPDAGRGRIFPEPVFIPATIW